MKSSGYISGLSLIGLIQVGCIFITIFSLASFFDQFHWIIELLTHFKVQYFLLSLFFSVIFILFKNKKFALISIFTVLINFSGIAPAYISNKPLISKSSKPVIKLISYNVLSSNTQYSQLIDQIQKEQADIILLQEVNKTWLDNLSPLKSVYHFQINTPRYDNFGMALWSKFPITDQKVHKWGKFNIPSIEAKLQFHDTEFFLIATHPLPPVSKELSIDRNNQLLKLTSRVKLLNGPMIVMGDLNITHWSSHYQLLESETGLKNVRKGFGVIPTWPTNMLPLMIPIDHCLVSEHFQVIDVNSGEKFGSDHLPLIIELSFNGK